MLWRASGRRLFVARWDAVHHTNAKRLATGFGRLGGIFIKLGQVISVLGTFLPPAYSNALERLQDAVPPKPFAQIRPRLIEAWGDDWFDRFQCFDKQAIAAASLAQVHRAVLLDGTEVAVKVLYPDVRRLIAADLRVIRWVLPIVHWGFGFRRMASVLEQLTQMLADETDYRHEIANIERLRILLADRDDVIVPTAFADLSNDAVLVLSFETGAKLNASEALVARGVDAEKLADTLVDCYLTMLLDHRVFHADPHPGNFLVRNGKLVILDYGAVAEVSEALVGGLKKVILGGLSRNAAQVLEGVEEMGFMAEDGDRDLLRKVGHEYLHALASMRVESFKELTPGQLRGLTGLDQLRGRLRRVAASVRYPEGYFYLERTMVLLFGVVAQLAPAKGLLGIAAPLASRALLRSYSRKAENSNPPQGEAKPL